MGLISIVIASSGRANLLRAMLDSLRETTKDHEIEVVFVLDGYIFESVCSFLERIGGSHILDCSANKRGALLCWNRGLQLSTGDIIVPAGDDQIFHEGWLDFALASFREKLGGYGVLGMNDLAYDGNEQLATMYMLDRKFIKDHLGGVLCPPVYHYFCVDSEINAKAKSLGIFFWEKRAIVEHVHSAHGKREADEGDRLKVENDWQRIDNETFERRKATGFQIEWTPLI